MRKKIVLISYRDEDVICMIKRCQVHFHSLQKAAVTLILPRRLLTTSSSSQIKIFSSLAARETRQTNFLCRIDDVPRKGHLSSSGRKPNVARGSALLSYWNWNTLTCELVMLLFAAYWDISMETVKVTVYLLLIYPSSSCGYCYY